MSDAITAAIRREIQQAQQPLLEKIAELESEMRWAEDYIWKLNVLVSELMKAFPAEYAQQAAEELGQQLADLTDEQHQERCVLELNYWRLRLEEQATPHGG